MPPQQKQKRKRYTSLKPAKKMMLMGDHYGAITILVNHRKRLMKQLNRLDFEPSRRPHEIELALVNHQLSLAYEAVGNHKMADKRSQQAIEHYAGPNRLGFAILLRDDGWRMLGRGRAAEAKQLIEQALRIIQALSESGENVPRERIDTERWVTQGYLGQVFIATGEKAKAVALLRAVDHFLKDGSKRDWELNNLMALIPHTRFIEKRLLILRALKLNKNYVHNRDTWFRLVSHIPVGTPLPRIVESFLR